MFGLIPRSSVNASFLMEGKMYVSRDYYYKRVGWRWEVWTRLGDQHFKIGQFRFWRWRTACRVANEVFAAYHNGRDAERGRPQTP